ncbi:MAG: ATP-binding protein [Parachlamydiaceae bacterium]
MMKSFPADLGHLYAMLALIRDQAREAGFSDCFLNKIELATEEVLVNIINHGYPFEKGRIIISCVADHLSGIEIKIQDEGIPYNPLEEDRGTNTRNDPLDTKVVGGYGVFFILNLMDEVLYSRHQNMNVLILKKFH